MISVAAATYTPDYQVIRFKSNFSLFADPDNPQVFETPHQLGFFIHEWIHFLHNVSTIHGICAYSHLAVLWSNIRTFVFEDVDRLDVQTAGQHATDIQRQLKFWLHARKAKSNNLPAGLSHHDVKFVSCELKKDFIDDDPRYECSEIVCQAEVKGKDGVSIREIKIGCHEIVESVAFMLEEKYLNSSGEVPIPVALDPYYLLKSLSALVSPDISTETALRCGLLSLQHTEPLGLLLGFLSRAQAAMNRNEDPDSILVESAKKYLLDNQALIERNIDLVESIFPTDEPMARAVRYSTGKMRDNYRYRTVNPFFEMELVVSFAEQPRESLLFALEKFGVGFLIQERSGDANKPMRDLMYDLSLADLKDPGLSDGRRIAQAAFSYALQFLSRSSDELIHPVKYECPFYSCCNSVFRKQNPADCKNTPWVTQDLDLASMCFFGRAVINTKGEARGESALK